MSDSAVNGAAQRTGSTGPAEPTGSTGPAGRTGLTGTAERTGTGERTGAAERTGTGETARPGQADGPALHARGDTRVRIQEIAVELFSEHGYEGTSLREIAERLGVTKAALYYHFKSKEDIVHSLVDDYFSQVDTLVEWAQEQPRTPEIRVEVLRRYLDMVADRHHVYRMLHQNQAALASLKSGEDHGQLFRARMNAIVSVLAEPGASLPDRVRATAAATSVSICWMFFQDEVDDPDALRAAILDVATELAAGQPAAR